MTADADRPGDDGGTGGAATVRPRPSTRELVAAAFREPVELLPAVAITDDDIRHAHLGADQLGALTTVCGAALDGSFRDSIAGELRWLHAAVASAHDLEVLHGVLSACRNELSAADAINLERLFATLEDGHDRARVRAREALGGERYASLRARLVVAAADPPVACDDSGGRGRRGDGWAADALALAWDRLAREVEALDADQEAPPIAAHDAARRARLASRALAPALPPALDRRLAASTRALGALQRCLGAQRGAAVADLWVREHAVGTSAAETFATGMVSGLLRSTVNRARAALPSTWSKAVRRKARTWS